MRKCLEVVQDTCQRMNNDMERLLTEHHQIKSDFVAHMKASSEIIRKIPKHASDGANSAVNKKVDSLKQ